MIFRYVVGFAYTDDGRCLLLRKNRPKWQEGLLNGIGGKIEDGESPEEAMGRESMEEVGLDLDWRCRGMMSGENNDGSLFECHVFYAKGAKVESFRRIEAEKPGLYSLAEMLAENHLSCLEYLIPFGLSGDDRAFVNIRYRQDVDDDADG